MKNYVKIDCAKRQIVMDRTFARNARIVGSEEYNKLQMARRDYEGFTVITRTINRNSNKECYHGLTYAYMERYILLHGRAEERKKEFDELRLISQCHSKRYPIIKQWFLDTYPEIVKFGMPALDEQSSPKNVTASKAITTQQEKDVA